MRPGSRAGGLRLGIDVGATKTEAVAIAPTGAVVHELRLPTALGEDGVLATIGAAIDAVRAATRLDGAGVTSVGIGIPGAVDPVTGRVSHAVNLDVEDLDLAALVELRTGLAVRVENDVKAAALGAYHALGEGVRSMAYLNLGTGLAAGLVIDGQLWRGARGIAGEIGHIPVADGPECPCGQRGCLELYASGSALARMWPTTDPQPVRALFAAADAGDETARDVRRSFIASVASAVRILVLTMDVDSVVIGGGISTLGAPLLAALRRALEAQGATSPFLASQDLPPRVRLVPRDVPVAALGAALVGVSGYAWERR
ncbi:MAG: ROK family protein [Micromonosporaceae bacterium]|jgi:glucokinase